MSPYRVGIIGCGTMALALVPRLAACGHFKVVAAWDPSPQASLAMAALVPGATRDSAEAVYADPDVDLVYIASPPGSHLTYLAAAAAGGKAVLCEKPLAIDVAASDALVARARREGWRVAVNFGFSVSPPVQQLTGLLRDGAIGTLARAEVRLRFRQWPRPWQADAGWLARSAEGGFSREVLSHFLFLLIRRFGAARILAHKVAYPDDPLAAETQLQARLSLGGLPVDIDAAIAGQIDDDNSCTFVGTTGRLRLADWYCVQRDDGNGWQALAGIDREHAYQQTRDGLLIQLQAFAGGDAHSLATLEEAWQVQQTVEELLCRD